MSLKTTAGSCLNLLSRCLRHICCFYSIRHQSDDRKFLYSQSDRIEILFGSHFFLARQKLTSAIRLAMFCKQRRWRTSTTVHHTKSWLKVSFYRSIRIYRVGFEKMYNISSMIFFLRTPLCSKRTKMAETSLRLRVQYQCLKIRHLNEI